MLGYCRCPGCGAAAQQLRPGWGANGPAAAAICGWPTTPSRHWPGLRLLRGARDLTPVQGTRNCRSYHCCSCTAGADQGGVACAAAQPGDQLRAVRLPRAIDPTEGTPHASRSDPPDALLAVAPATRPTASPRPQEAGADVLIIDLEGAVSPADKPAPAPPCAWALAAPAAAGPPAARPARQRARHPGRPRRS